MLYENFYTMQVHADALQNYQIKNIHACSSFEIAFNLVCEM